MYQVFVMTHRLSFIIYCLWNKGTQVWEDGQIIILLLQQHGEYNIFVHRLMNLELWKEYVNGELTQISWMNEQQRLLEWLSPQLLFCTFALFEQFIL